MHLLGLEGTLAMPLVLAVRELEFSRSCYLLTQGDLVVWFNSPRLVLSVYKVTGLGKL